MVAVSYVHEQFETITLPRRKSSSHIHISPPDNNFFLDHYNQAIKASLARPSTSSTSYEAMLITCLLFITLEYLQGNSESALMHLGNGIRMLRQYQSISRPKDELRSPTPPCYAGSIPSSDSTPFGECVDTPPTSTVRVSNKSDETITTQRDVNGSAPPLVFKIPPSIAKDVVAPIFSRLGILAAFFGQPLFELLVDSNDLSSLSIPGCFTSIQEARNTLTLLLTQTFAFNRQCTPGRYDPSHVLPPLAIKKQIESLVSQWAASFSCFLLVNLSRLSSSLLQGATILQTHQRVASIFMATCYSFDEVAFDAFLADFEAIVTLSSGIIDDDNNVFSFEMGTVPPLYWTAIKCRHHIIRHKALSLLLRSPRREALWDSKLDSRAACRVIEIEEAGLVWNDRYSPEEAFRLVPEERRVHNSRISRERPSDVHKHQITMMMRPGGPGTPMVAREEYV